MKLVLVFLVATVLSGLLIPPDCLAPLIWRKSEGWNYEKHGVIWGNSPQDQLKIAQKYHENKNWGTAASAYRRIIRRWPTSFAAQDARFGLAECLTGTGYHYKAFKEYQNLIEKNPDTKHFDTVLRRQFEIGNLFQAGERDKVAGLRLFASLDKGVEIYKQVIKNGLYSEVAPEAQFQIGKTREKQKDIIKAVKAYEELIERYPKNALAETSQFQIGLAYKKQASDANYDQYTANQAIIAFTDFRARYPKSNKVALADRYIQQLQQEQAKGLFSIGEFYEKNKNIKAALIYYNEVIEKTPDSRWANQARGKVEDLNSQFN